MGSRAVVILCQSEDVARQRFGITGEGIGIVYTRTGRRFFEDRQLETALLSRVKLAADAAGLWQEFATDWFCLDCELMPWSVKAHQLLRQQYAAVGAAARTALAEAVPLLHQAAQWNSEAAPLQERYQQRVALASQYIDAYRRYCWSVNSLTDLKLAPFHLLATEGAVHVDRDHIWHLETLARLCQADAELLLATSSDIHGYVSP